MSTNKTFRNRICLEQLPPAEAAVVADLVAVVAVEAHEAAAVVAVDSKVAVAAVDFKVAVAVAAAF